MDLLKYILLGFIQGFTETIPVSSSGHLMIFKKLMSVNVDYDTIAILTNFGSLIAIIILFWDDIVKIIRGFFKYLTKKDDNKIGVKEALTVGCFQILGLFPGISRSGSTIVGGMTQGLKRDTAFKYSFMLYIPMSIAAMALEIMDLNIDSSLIFYYICSVVVSLVVTLLVTKWFRKIVNNGKLIYFSIYCFVVGLLVILFLK